MQNCISRFTVFFEDPYWVGVYERFEKGRLEACKITFGAEPKDYDVFDYLLKNWHALRFSPPVKANMKPETKVSPKRALRKAKSEIVTSGMGTKSQEALKLQHEVGLEGRKKASREQKIQDDERRFELRQIKQKEKHKGH